jgi:predicted nucleic acid-binding protein
MVLGPVLPETRLVLDTDVVNDWRYQKPHVRRAIRDYLARFKQPPRVTAITIFEVFYGFEGGATTERTQHDRAETEQLLQSCEVLPFDQAAAKIAAYIFPRLSDKQRKKHLRDLFIAATALAHNHGIATRNQSDFELIASHLPPSYPLLRLAVWKP